MEDAGRRVWLAETARVVVKGDDALLHNLSNGSWCRVSRYAAEFFARKEGVDLAGEAAVLAGPDAVAMLRIASDLARAGMVTDRKALAPKRRVGIDKAYLIVTRQCNLGCPACYMGDASREDYSGAMLRKSLISLLDAKPGKLFITGGEPTLRDDLEELIKAAQVVPVVLCTNGTMPDRVPYGALLETGGRMQISVESCSEADHDRLRGSGAYKAAMETARRAAGIGIPVELVPTVGAAGSLDLAGMASFAGSLGAGCHGSLLVNVGRAKQMDTRSENWLLDMMADYLQKCSARGEIESCSSLEDIMPMMSKSSCGAGNRIISCSGDGRMHPCHLMVNSELESFDVAHSVDNDENCKDCDVRYLCGGGCRAAASANGGRDPNCGMYKAVYSAFAWGWDDQESVTINLSRLARHAG